MSRDNESARRAIKAALAIPEPTGPAALRAWLDANIGEQGVAMRAEVRRLMMGNALLTRGQCFEGSMRIVRAAAESCLASESDRLTFALYLSDLIEDWMNEARPALEN